MAVAIRYTVLGVVAYLSFLVMLFPASTAVSLASSYFPQISQLQLAGIQGSVWNGSAASVAYQYRNLGSVNWQLDFMPLLIGKVSVKVSVQTLDGYLDADVGVSPYTRQVTLGDVQGLLSVADIRSMLPPYPLQVDGMLSLALEHATLDGSGRLLDVSGSVNLNQLSAQVNREYKLGDFHSAISTQEEGHIQAELTSINGPLNLNLNASLLGDGSYRVDGVTSAKPSADKNLQQALTWLGKPDVSGNYPIKLKGRL